MSKFNLDFKVIFGKVLKPGDSIGVACYKRGQLDIESSVPLGIAGEREAESESDFGSYTYFTTRVAFNEEIEPKLRAAIARAALNAAAKLELYNVSSIEDAESPAQMEWSVTLEFPDKNA